MADTPAPDFVEEVTQEQEITPEAPATDNEVSEPTTEAPVEETEAEEQEPATEATPEAEQADNQPEDSKDEPPVDPKEEARRRYEERQRLLEERRQKVQEQAQDYIKSGEDEYDQRLRSMEVQQYARTIEDNENKLVTEFERAKANPDLQIFNPDNKDVFNEKAYDKAMRDFSAGYLQYDDYGNMVSVKGSLYQHLMETAEILNGVQKAGQVQQVRATQKMRQVADTKPAAPPREAQKDPILDILSED